MVGELNLVLISKLYLFKSFIKFFVTLGRIGTLFLKNIKKSIISKYKDL